MSARITVQGSTLLRGEPLDAILETVRDDSGQTENLILHGPSGSGKTTLLAQANTLFRLLTATALIDCKAYRPDTVPEMMQDVRDQMAAPVRGLPRYRFPRLDLALAAVSQGLTPLTDFEAEWRNLTRGSRDFRREQRRKKRAVAGRAQKEMAFNIQFAFKLPFFDIKFRPDRKVRVGPPPLPRRIPREVRQWFASHGWEPMIYSYPEKTGSDDPREASEREWAAQTSRNEWLVHAFLTDLRESNGRAGQYRCVLFLDDVDSLRRPARYGGGIPALFRSAQAAPAGARDEPLPLLLVGSTPEPERMEKTRTLAVPDFGRSDLHRLADLSPHPIDGYFPELVHGLTGGYVDAGSTLLRHPAIARLRAHDGLHRLLREPWEETRDSPTLEDHLCLTLAKALFKETDLDLDEATLEALAICSLAKVREDVGYLVGTYDLAEDLVGLGDRSWLAWNENSGPARSARALLMRLLLRRWQAHDEWTRCDRTMAFRRLAARADLKAADGPGRHPNWHYYSLGAGDLMRVCLALDRLLDRPGNEERVVGLIRHATTVPQPALDDPGSGSFTPLERYKFLVGNRGPERGPEFPPILEDRLGRLVRIVAGRWIINDPLESMYTKNVHLRVRSALLELGTMCGDSRPFETEAEFHESTSLERPVNPLDDDLELERDRQ
ncbi:hypothetical protein [Salininema proteolyticum]|uniref:AAA+ ATPase domain-containing protein n=1 Tax=Salininema proteolyticum TaxID=1607685 RepID=A0ABV8U1L8_9ACTN